MKHLPKNNKIRIVLKFDTNNKNLETQNKTQRMSRVAGGKVLRRAGVQKSARRAANTADNELIGHYMSFINDRCGVN